MTKVELGSFTKREGWMTVDKDPRADLPWDLTNPLPFCDNTIDGFYSSHLLEHLPYPHPMKTLIISRLRCLKPGGFFSVAVPNARLYIEGYGKGEPYKIPKSDLYPQAYHYFSPIDIINYLAYLDGLHHFMFDVDNLPLILADAGFVDTRIRPFNPELDMEARDHESIYAIGFKRR